jgi:hypothetical protein
MSYTPQSNITSEGELASLIDYLNSAIAKIEDDILTLQSLQGNLTLYGDLDANGNRIINLQDTPRDELDAVTFQHFADNPAGQFASPVSIALANASGSANTIVRSDHVHAHPVFAGNDLHTQYILADGTRAFTGNQSFGDKNITNVGDISLDTISDDAGVESTLTIAQLNAAYDHSQDNSQAHTDYLINNGDDSTTGSLSVDGNLDVNSNTNKLRVGTSQQHTLGHNAGFGGYMDFQTTGTAVNFGSSGASLNFTMASSSNSKIVFSIANGDDHIGILNGANANVNIFDNAASGETKELKIFGYKAGDAKRSLEIGVGVDADDTASFDGLSNYQFDGSIKTTSFLVLNKVSGNGIKVDTATPVFGWRDILGEPKGNNTGASKPTFASYQGGLYQYQFAAGDEDFWEFHIPHDYVPGTDVYLHIHWSHTSTLVTGGTVTFEVESSYAKGHNQAAFSAPVTGTFTGNASTTQYQHIISETQYSDSSPSGYAFC